MKKKTILELDRVSQEEFKKKNKIPLIVILDNVRSLNNVGSVFRTSDAFLVKAVYLCGITATPPHPEIHKTALGAEDSVEWHYFEDTNAAVDKCDQSVEIPQFGTKHSLNVSVTAGLVIWDFFKMLR